ncbi:N-acetyltransferase [Paenarthrobacter ureafaciens]|uniref:GNAT family N-acetyltransferase n=1 Tax=Paenarthrobacter ureafaciens TaxID=37931 RepID=UPI0015BB8620|nr:GNAT family N-acetyltransferase [Paenarthrobacter ureafaciens]MEC3852806.1 GNAT family N-acetyltransferase [Paenarthrobacter ureafaciens]NWL29413.1 N-acetyltransferase [Paenarthrobacter ureafaciens]
MRFTFRPVDPVADAPVLHSWVSREYARFWGMAGCTEQDVVEEYSGIVASGHHQAFLGLDGGVPAFLMERYLPEASPLADVYEVQPGDVGMHLLVSPPSGTPQSGFTTSVMQAVMTELFDDPATRRVVVEPDARNHKIHVLNQRVGFRPHGVVTLPAVDPAEDQKQGLLSFCTREDFLATLTPIPAVPAAATEGETQ